MRVNVPTLMLWMVVLSGGMTASASEPEDLRALLAHPETPAIGLSYRDGLRALVGIEMPVVDEDNHNGWGFYVPVLVELFNDFDSDQGLPNEYWRAYLALDVRWRKRFDSGVLRRLELSAAIRHQSDHHTGRDDAGRGQLQLNDLRLRTEMLFPIGEMGFLLSGEVWVVAQSCTKEYHCGTFLGDWTAGGAVDLMFDLKAGDAKFMGWSGFAALHASGIIPNGLVIEEARLVFRTGARIKMRLGQWQLYGIMWLGNAVGIKRPQQVLHFGGGFRWPL